MRFRPTRRNAVAGALVGAGLVVVAITSIEPELPFLIAWCSAVVIVVFVNLWLAFRGGD
jgi:hypothetical protein